MATAQNEAQDSIKKSQKSQATKYSLIQSAMETAQVTFRWLMINDDSYSTQRRYHFYCSNIATIYYTSILCHALY